MAGRIAGGGDFVDSNGFRSVRAPLYPFFLAGTFALSGGSVALAHVLGCLLGTLSVYLTYLLTRQVWNDVKSAIFSAGIVALHPSLVIYSTLLLTETLYIVLLLGLFLAAVRFLRLPLLPNAALLGIAGGLASLTRPVAFGFFPVVLGLLYWLSGGRTMRGLAVAAGFFLLVLAPWTIRNAVVLGELVPVATGGGSSLLTGNNPYATGTWRVEPGFDEWFDRSARSQGVADPVSLSETERSSVSARMALNFIRSDPARALWLALKKSHVFWIYPISHTDSDTTVQTIAMAGDVALLSLVAVGIAAAGGRGRTLALFLAAGLYFWLLQAVLHSEARFRLPLLPLGAVVAGYGCACLADGTARRRLFGGGAARRKLVLGLAAVAAIYGVTTWMVFIHRI
jgi:Dolichyl-phosphate-mannose-protein mannosyltransferase